MEVSDRLLSKFRKQSNLTILERLNSSRRYQKKSDQENHIHLKVLAKTGKWNEAYGKDIG